MKLVKIIIAEIGANKVSFESSKRSMTGNFVLRKGAKDIRKIVVPTSPVNKKKYTIIPLSLNAVPIST